MNNFTQIKSQGQNLVVSPNSMNRLIDPNTKEDYTLISELYKTLTRQHSSSTF